MPSSIVPDLTKVVPALDDPARRAAVEHLEAVELPVDAITEELEDLADSLRIPLAAATYVDGERQHFIATNEGPKPALDRGVSHCQYVIATGAFICIQDASFPESGWSKLKRSIVRGEPLAAYLGFPLSYDGQVIGAVCAVDTQPRIWTPDEHFAVYQASVRVRELVGSAATLGA